MVPMIVLFVLFVIPLVELMLFLEVGEQIGVFPTIFATILTAAAGAVLAKKQGVNVIRTTKTSLDAGEFPVLEALNGVGILAGALMLFTPGFFTDTIGVCLFIPKLRVILVKKILTGLSNKTNTSVFNQTSMGHSDPRHGPIIDAKVKSAINRSRSDKGEC